MDFLRTLLYIVLGFYVFKFLLRLLAPKLIAFALKRLQKKMGNNFSAGFGGSSPFGGDSPFRASSESPKKEATKEKTSKPLKDKDPVGEYIDFEEIE
jgi:hypothetical protein